MSCLGDAIIELVNRYPDITFSFSKGVDVFGSTVVISGSTKKSHVHHRFVLIEVHRLGNMDMIHHQADMIGKLLQGGINDRGTDNQELPQSQVQASEVRTDCDDNRRPQ